ncbi:alpha-tectorin-like [Poecilia formosa]|uniref:alpha-tectorin-like n=1 Tax=Poecilia formosa TaxID=48698 RepID=UPI0004438B67|nr:PREDICTED: alpha-tectorin-like [Poecilia formosa]
MLCFKLCLIGFSMLTAAAGSHQAFTSSAEMNISSCPITYYGQKYEKVYVGFEADRFAVCFKGLYQPGIQNDCILMSGGTADRGGLSVLSREIPTGSGVHKLLPNLKYAGKCVNVIPLTDSQQSQVEQVELGNFGAQSILAIKTYSGYTDVNVVADAQVNGLTVSKQTFQTSETNSGVITDVSGCRFSGLAYETNTTVNDPRICCTVTCDVSGAATAVSHCGPMEHCQGDGSCAMNAVCSVTGSTVIGFTSRPQSVPDRCGYSLLRSSSLPGLHVLGIFKERRRKDLSFLDRVVLQLDREGAQISLEQGSKVKVNDDFLTVHATPQMVHSVALTKSHAGVTAKLEASNYTVSVVFDGQTAIIHLTGSSEAPVQGLCGDSSSAVNEQKSSEYSDTDCEMQYDDDADSTSSCNTTAKRCNLLQEGSFTACNSYVDPEPFVQACTQTLCKYPAVDDLTCHFLKGYAEVCKYKSNVTVQDWRSHTSCAVPQATCQDMFCGSHEFCAVDSSSGEARCHCRALFASKYKPTNSFGEPIVCADKGATVTLANCLLEDKGIDYSVLHLNDQSCRGQLDNLTHMVTFSFSSQNTCGTVVQANNSQIIYKNAIMTQNISMFGLITRHDKVHMDFSCYYSQPDVKTLSVRFRQSSVIQHISSGEWKYNLTMEAYTSRDRTKPIDSDADIDLNQRLWVELKTYGLEEDRVAVVTDSCWATDRPSPAGGLRYNLIINGCPNPKDPTVAVEGNGLGTSTVFSFNTFQFTGSSGNVFLHCKVELCVRQGDNCIQRCAQTARGRRSARPKYETVNLAFISVAWTY